MSTTFLDRSLQVTRFKSVYQPEGLPLFMSEFGATRSVPLLSDETEEGNLFTLGWVYWSWKYYQDPTGSSAEGAIAADGKRNIQTSVLQQTYPLAVAGAIANEVSDPTTGLLYLTYTSDPRVSAPTLIWVPVHERFPHGYCADVGGATVVSAPNATVLEIRGPPTANKVVVAVVPRNAGVCY